MSSQGPQTEKIFLAIGALALAVLLSRASSGGFSGLGDKKGDQNRYLAKKFWGTMMLANQGALSMSLLGSSSEDEKVKERVRKLIIPLTTVAHDALAIAEEYDLAWVTKRVDRIESKRSKSSLPSTEKRASV